MANEFDKTVGALFQGMDGFLSSKTVVGEPTKVGETIILPLVDVNFGVAAGAFNKANGSNNAGGGIGGKMIPRAVLVIKDNSIKMVQVGSQDMAGKIIDMVPEVIDKIAEIFGKKEIDEDVEAAIKEIK